MATKWARVQLESEVYVVREIRDDPLFDINQEALEFWHSYDTGDYPGLVEGWTWDGEIFAEPEVPSRAVANGFLEACRVIYSKLTSSSDPITGQMMVDYIRDRDLGSGTTPTTNEWKVYIDNVIYEGVTNYAAPDFEGITAPTTTFADVVAEVDVR